MTHRCMIDNCNEPTPLGLRRPGLYSKIPPAKRGYLWFCKKHREQAKERQRRAA